MSSVQWLPSLNSTWGQHSQAPSPVTCCQITNFKKYKKWRNIFCDCLSWLVPLFLQGYNPDDLPLTVSFKAALKIDQCIIAQDKVIADKCSTKTSICGSAVLVNYMFDQIFRLRYGSSCFNYFSYHWLALMPDLIILIDLMWQLIP